MSNYNYIIGGRSTGKTRKLLEHAKENNALVVCKNPAAMARKAEAYGIFGLAFASYEDTLNNIRDVSIGNVENCENVVVDEAKEYFDYLLASECIGFTLTEDD